MQLRYNIPWVEHTFPSKIATESLLRPEYEAGNLSTNDFEAATRFLPGFHRHYRHCGALLSLPLFFALRRPHWSNIKSYVFLLATSCTGYLVGQSISLTAHYNFVRSIENPTDFAQALDNIQKKSGLSSPVAGPTIIRQGDNKWSTDYDPEAPPTDAAPTTRSSTASISTADVNSASIKPLSKWDQIRAANSHTSTNSSWDALRQHHERERVSSTASIPSAADMPARPRADNRAAEQAKFDEMLEKERNVT